MNCQLRYPSGVTDNELRAWNHAGLFQAALNERDIPALPSLAKIDDSSRSLEDRARSYLDANCAHCHRPGGTVAAFDTRYDLPLPQQKLIGAPVLIDQGLDGARAIAPNDPWRSIVFMRLNSVEAIKMPPLAHQVRDEQGAALVREWIKSLPGRAVLDPPLISPPGGHSDKPAIVTLRHSDPGAVIHYTLDGSAPTASDPAYEKPITLEGPAVVRARAYKPGFTRSITVQEIFVVGE
jgi:mono/diheme cytochrome c family protein